MSVDIICSQQPYDREYWRVVVAEEDHVNHGRTNQRMDMLVTVVAAAHHRRQKPMSNITAELSVGLPQPRRHGEFGWVIQGIMLMPQCKFYKMSNRTAFANALNEWTQIEHNVCDRRAARSPLRWWPCFSYLSYGYVCNSACNYWCRFWAGFIAVNQYFPTRLICLQFVHMHAIIAHITIALAGSKSVSGRPYDPDATTTMLQRILLRWANVISNIVV